MDEIGTNNPGSQPADHEIEELQQQLELTRLSLEQRAGEIECVRHLVAHDLRAPLRTIDAFSRILLEEASRDLNPESKVHVERVHRAVRAMERLLDDALAFLRPLDPATHDPIDLSAQASQIADDFQRSDPNRHVTVLIQDNLRTQSNARLVSSLLTYLMDNAWKFTSKRSDANIEFGSLTIGNELAYFVRDNGAGFDTQYGHKLFLPFQSLHSTSQFPGNGIGLAMAHRIVRHLGGRIWAEAEVGQGATFYFTLGTR